MKFDTAGPCYILRVAQSV